jgi:hypothetical protein
VQRPDHDDDPGRGHHDHDGPGHHHHDRLYARPASVLPLDIDFLPLDP